MNAKLQNGLYFEIETRAGPVVNGRPDASDPGAERPPEIRTIPPNLLIKHRMLFHSPFE